MAKESKHNISKATFGKESREKRIENCTTCHGSPETETSNLQGLVTKFCSKCLEIVDYHKEGKPIVVTEKTAAVRKSILDPEYVGPNETKITSFIPGDIIQFKDIIE